MKTNKAFALTNHSEPLAPASVISYHRTLSSVLSRAVKWGYIRANPADAAEKPSLGRHEAAFLEEADARRLLELLQAEHIRWRALITFDLMSGLRRGELLGLRWQDVDFDEHTVTIRQTSNYLPGKGIYVSTPKSASSARPLLLSTAAIMMLLEYREWQDAQREKLGDAWEDQDGRVFTTDTGAPIFPDSVTQWFSGFIARSGIPKVTVHSLRHPYVKPEPHTFFDLFSAINGFSIITPYVQALVCFQVYLMYTQKRASAFFRFRFDGPASGHINVIRTLKLAYIYPTQKSFIFQLMSICCPG